MINENKPDSQPESGPHVKTVNFGKVDYSKTQHGRFYANHVGVNMTLFDIRLILSDVDVAGDGVSAAQTMTVLMTPELAVLVHSILGKTLQNFTASFGKHRLPETALGLVEVEPPG